MNAIALWAPGALVVVVGFALLVLERVTLPVGIAIIAAGAIVESAGVLLWIKQRGPAKK